MVVVGCGDGMLYCGVDNFYDWDVVVFLCIVEYCCRGGVVCDYEYFYVLVDECVEYFE